MAFFVEEVGKSQKRHDHNSVSERIDLEWIAVGKRAGLSLTEINELRIRDLSAYVDIYTAGTNKNKTRKATQADIDAFYAI